MAETVVSIVVGRLTDLLSEEAQLFHGLRDEIQGLVTEFVRMKTFLRDADSRISENKIRIMVSDIRDLAYNAEHVVETYLLKASSSGERNRTKQAIKYSMKIKEIEKKMSLVYDCFGDYKITSTLESAGLSNSSNGTSGKLKRFYTYATPEPEIFVEFHGDVDLLVGHLVNESDDCYKIVSICGMGGLGKTTLAEKIYNHSTIKTCFAGLAWVTISQKWQRKQALQRILICLIHEKKKEILTWDDDKLVENLLQIQQSKKCLIVLDDIWSTDAWDSFKAAFPAEKSRSRLLLTSRNDNVAEHANPNGFVHRPVLLNLDQSWELLKLKALPKGGDCLDITRDPKRMEELGREMVRYCGGLPLAIVMLGGILVTKPSLIEWEKVYTDGLSSRNRGRGLGEKYQNQISEVLVWSYDDLPLQLKPCFLYLGKYNEDESIDAETLYQLWIAEGIILSSDKRREGETMMQVAESYLGELVHRSMVQVRFNDVKSFINFKSCSLHDLMRVLSISKAESEEFFKVIDLQPKTDPHVSASADFRYPNTRQLVVLFDDGKESKKHHYFGKKADQQRHRSMLLVNQSGTRSLPPALGSRIANFRCLRVLSLEVQVDIRLIFPWSLSRINLGRVLGSLVYLRYLRVSDVHLKIFPSIQKLMLLETLNLDRQFEIYFPPWLSRNILSMLGRLRHLYLPSLGVKGIKKSSKLRFIGLSKLETLENFDTNWCEVKDLPNLISLQKLTLKVSCYDMEEMMENLAAIALSSSSCLQYLELSISTRDQALKNCEDMLRKLWKFNFNLQRLKISGELPEFALLFEQQSQQLLPTHMDVSSVRITRLILSQSCLEEDPMPVLEKIATLRNLDLSFYSYLGKEMICSATGFPKLTNLTLTFLLGLEKWRVEEGSMPVLSDLAIVGCSKLEELPQGMKFLNSLQTLVLDWMPLEFCDKLRTENGEKGADFYKVAHIPSLQIKLIRN